MATSSQGENKKCRTKLMTVRATMAMTARAMIQGMVIGVRSGWAVAVVVSGSGAGGPRSCPHTAAAGDAGRSGLPPAYPWSACWKASG